MSSQTQDDLRYNWAGNLKYSAKEIATPTSTEEVQQLVKSNPICKALGTRHSFNKVADTTGLHISLQNFQQIQEPENGQVTLQAGVRYGELASFLQQRGLALHNLASLPHISVVGACATATHGSGRQNGNLATAVTAMKLVTWDGQLTTYNTPDQINQNAVHRGEIGIVTEITLKTEPTYNVNQMVYQDIPLNHALDNFQEISNSGYSVSLFTHWLNNSVSQIWVKQRTPNFNPPNTLFQKDFSKINLHPITHMPAQNCTEQCGIPGPWHQRLPHFKLEFTPSAGEELQSEFFIAFQDAPQAIQALYTLGPKIQDHLLVTEIRFIAKDNLQNSPCYQQEKVGIHFTWVKDPQAVAQSIQLVKQTLAPYKPIPHWGKLS